MLIGSFEFAVDTKGRINIPAKLKEDLGERFIITRGLDNCIAVYPMETWKSWEEKIKLQPESKSRNLKRFFFAGATEVTLDKQGRILIPPMLRQHASLDKDVIIIGAGDRAEIWNADHWHETECELTSDAIASEMDDLNF